MLLAVFRYCAVRFVWDLVENHIVGFSHEAAHMYAPLRKLAHAVYREFKSGKK